MKLRILLPIFAALILPLPASLLAQDETEATAPDAMAQNDLRMRTQQIIGIVNGDLSYEDVFTDRFLSAVPPAQITATSQQFTAQFGEVLSVESVNPRGSNAAEFTIRMERAIARGQIAIDPLDDGKIDGLSFEAFEPVNVSVEQIEADLAALPGDVSWWFGQLDRSQPPVMASEWGDQMPIGSTFKLYVLAALGREIAQGKLAWDDVVTLSDTRSFPSGMAQDWPQGASVTLETLASLMISISDNTATDALIGLLGRDTVLQVMIDSGHAEPSLNNPFLTTRELFLLKSGSQGRIETYTNGDAELRKQVLDGIEDTPMSLEQISAAFTRGPVALDVEWFASASDLTALLRHMRQTSHARVFEVMAIKPNLPETAQSRWTYAGYKGGSEPGVLNLTWLLTDEAGKDHALVLSWRNDKASLDQTTLELIAQRILSLPR